MCLLTFLPPWVMPVDEHLANGIEMNPHGFGWALITKDKHLLTGRGMDPEEVLDSFLSKREDHPEGPALFHSRLSTGGLRYRDNCHPFTAGNDRRTVIAHNGTLFKATGYRSDTREFAEDIYPRDFAYGLDDPEDVAELMTYVGKNKLVILTVNPQYLHMSYLVNGSLGFWVDKDGNEWDGQGEVPEGHAWHSNRDYTKPLTYRHEVPTMDGWYRVVYTDRTQEDCPVCYAKYALNAVTGVCQVCLACADCGNQVRNCTCYEGAGIK